ncbi:prepilin peptidase [Salibacterium salarium]|uniref:Prepilin leader peptidase/N-methyltransferase n=1 Tax=Salibacterium salarium TaxID=284579 RepID=A0A3R9WRW3_9BACI|nr:A24 family peptidase [Salibacterium salarium]RSL32266.1 prepilin peptidase [Salibacterium salarium]
MDVFWSVYIGVVGLILGSFFNVVGLRVPKGESVISPRSRCSSCRTTLQAIDLIPVLSYLMIGGKCRTCKARVSCFYPIIESLTAVLYLAAWFYWGLSWQMLAALLLISLLVIIIVSDISTMLIPDKILIVFTMPILLIRMTTAPLDPWWNAWAGAALGFVLLLVLAIISKGGMGGGDIKLFALLGLFFGWQGLLLTFFLAVFLGAVIGGVGLLVGKVQRGVPMPFGPFIAAGSIITLFSGDNLLTWYSGFFS